MKYSKREAGKTGRHHRNVVLHYKEMGRKDRGKPKEKEEITERETEKLEEDSLDY